MIIETLFWFNLLDRVLMFYFLIYLCICACLFFFYNNNFNIIYCNMFLFCNVKWCKGNYFMKLLPAVIAITLVLSYWEFYILMVFEECNIKVLDYFYERN